MGVAVADRLAARLIEHGLAADTPVAVIENGTLPTQRVVTGALRDLGPLVAERGIAGPAALVIGEVAGLVDPAVVEAAPPLPRLAGICA